MTSQAFPPFRLANDAVRAACMLAVMRAPEGWHCIIRPPTRTLDQNARLHAILADIAKSGKIHHEGRRFTVDDLKTLFVSAWMIENEMPSDIVPGFNGEAVQLRRSTTTFTKAELSSLMDYIESECARRGIPLTNRAPVEGRT